MNDRRARRRPGRATHGAAARRVAASPIVADLFVTSLVSIGLDAAGGFAARLSALGRRAIGISARGLFAGRLLAGRLRAGRLVTGRPSGVRHLAVGLLFAAALAIGPEAFAAGGPAVAAASSLRLALPEVVEAFMRGAQAGTPAPRISYGSSGNLARQVLQGAPFELILAADDRHVARLAEAGRLSGHSAVYAHGRLAILASPERPDVIDPALDGLAAAFAAGTIRRFAIANPRHAPYGVAARQALTHRGLWAAAEPRLALGENAAQAAQFALSQAADGGIVPYALALAVPATTRARHALLPADWHRPIVQSMALLGTPSTAARALFRFLLEPEAAAILARHGFELPPR